MAITRDSLQLYMIFLLWFFTLLGFCAWVYINNVASTQQRYIVSTSTSSTSTTSTTTNTTTTLVDGVYNISASVNGVSKNLIIKTGKNTPIMLDYNDTGMPGFWETQMIPGQKNVYTLRSSGQIQNYNLIYLSKSNNFTKTLDYSTCNIKIVPATVAGSFTIETDDGRVLAWLGSDWSDRSWGFLFTVPVGDMLFRTFTLTKKS